MGEKATKVGENASDDGTYFFNFEGCVFNSALGLKVDGNGLSHKAGSSCSSSEEDNVVSFLLVTPSSNGNSGHTISADEKGQSDEVAYLFLPVVTSPSSSNSISQIKPEHKVGHSGQQRPLQRKTGRNKTGRTLICCLGLLAAKRACPTP